MVLLNHLLERVRLHDGSVVWLGDEAEVAGPNAVDRTEHLVEFRLELGLPVWRYQIEGIGIEKRVMMPHGQNTVHVLYELLTGAAFARLDVTLAAHHRSHDAPVDTPALRWGA